METNTQIFICIPYLMETIRTSICALHILATTKSTLRSGTKATDKRDFTLVSLTALKAQTHLTKETNDRVAIHCQLWIRSLCCVFTPMRLVSTQPHMMKLLLEELALKLGASASQLLSLQSLLLLFANLCLTSFAFYSAKHLS